MGRGSMGLAVLDYMGRLCPLSYFFIGSTSTPQGSSHKMQTKSLLYGYNFSFSISTGLFVNCFFIAYMLSPRFCHRFVGYLEEEAVKTYTYCLKVNNLFKLTISCLTWEGGAILVNPWACIVVASWLDATILDKNVT